MAFATDVRLDVLKYTAPAILTVTPTLDLAATPGADPRAPRATVLRLGVTAGVTDLANRALAIGFSVLLARHLAPDDVGLIGAASLVAGLIGAAGFLLETAALIRHRHPGWSDAQQATVCGIVRLALAAALIVLARIGGPAFLEKVSGDSVRYAVGPSLLDILLVGVAFEATGALPRVRFQQELVLVPVFLTTVLQSFLQVALALVALESGLGPRGVCWAAAGAQMIACVVFWVAFMVRYGSPAAIPRDRGSVTWLLAEYSRLFLASFGTQLNTRLDNGLVGGHLGSAALAFYSMAWSASRAIVSGVSFVFESVVFPAQARKTVSPDSRDDLPLRVALVAQCVLALALGLVVSGADVLVTLVLGARWTPAIAPLRIMCATLILFPLAAAGRVRLLATGQSAQLGWITAAHSLLIVAFFSVLLPRFALIGGAIADALCQVGVFALLIAGGRIHRLFGTNQIRQSLAAVSAYGIGVAGASFVPVFGSAPADLVARWLAFILSGAVAFLITCGPAQTGAMLGRAMFVVREARRG